MGGRDRRTDQRSRVRAFKVRSGARLPWIRGLAPWHRVTATGGCFYCSVSCAVQSVTGGPHPGGARIFILTDGSLGTTLHCTWGRRFKLSLGSHPCLAVGAPCREVSESDIQCRPDKPSEHGASLSGQDLGTLDL